MGVTQNKRGKAFDEHNFLILHGVSVTEMYVSRPNPPVHQHVIYIRYEHRMIPDRLPPILQRATRQGHAGEDKHT